MLIRTQFDSFTDYLNAVSAKTDLPTSLRASHDTSSWREEFTGTKTFREALNLARKGWPEGCAKVKAISAEIVQKITDRILRPEVMLDVVGEVIEMGSYMEGIPECMLTWTEGEEVMQGSGERTLRVLLNFTASSTVSASVIQTRGAAVCALVEALEYAGRRCEVLATHVVAGDNGDTREDVIVVKRPEHPLQLDQLAFILCHPAMLRRLHFAYEETQQKAVRDNFGFYKRRGYGHPRPTSEKGDIMVPEAHAESEQWRDAEQARRWIMAQLKAQGVVLSE